jgi:hypothetical protein
VEGTKEEPNQTTDVITDIRPTIHQYSLQKTNQSSNVIKPSIIMQAQAQNFTKQDMVKGTMLNVVNKVRGYPPTRSDVAPSKDIHK